MPTQTTMQAIITLVRDLGEFRSTQLPSALLQRWIELACARLYDHVLDQDDARYSKTATYLLASGTQSYTLPTDFYRLQAVEVQDGSEYYRLYRQNFQNRNDQSSSKTNKKALRYEIRAGSLWFWPTPTFSATVRIFYAPTVQFTEDESFKYFDTINNWQDWIAFDVAVKAAIRIDENPASYVMERDRLWSAIKGKPMNADHAGPKTVTDVEKLVLNRYGRSRCYLGDLV